MLGVGWRRYRKGGFRDGVGGGERILGRGVGGGLRLLFVFGVFLFIRVRVEEVFIVLLVREVYCSKVDFWRLMGFYDLKKERLRVEF